MQFFVEESLFTPKSNVKSKWILKYNICDVIECTDMNSHAHVCRNIHTNILLKIYLSMARFNAKGTVGNSGSTYCIFLLNSRAKIIDIRQIIVRRIKASSY